MIRDCCLTTIRVTKLSMRSPLPNLLETKAIQDSDHLFWFKNRKGPHVYTITA